jgi:hypothetical protein
MRRGTFAGSASTGKITNEERLKIIRTSSEPHLKKLFSFSSTAATTDKSCFSIFQAIITEYMVDKPLDADYQKIDKHCHVGTQRSAVTNTFVYRGIRASMNTTNHTQVDRAKIRQMAIKTLQIIPKHVETINQILKEIDSIHSDTHTTQATLHRSAQLEKCIKQKILLKDLLSIAKQCVECELETMTILQYDLLHKIVINDYESLSRNEIQAFF